MEKSKTKGSGMLIAVVVIVLLALLSQCNKDSSSQSKTCGVCNKTFTNSEDVESISKYNLCKNCNDRYEFTQGLKEEMLKDKERNGD